MAARAPVLLVLAALAAGAAANVYSILSYEDSGCAGAPYQAAYYTTGLCVYVAPDNYIKYECNSTTATSRLCTDPACAACSAIALPTGCAGVGVAYACPVATPAAGAVLSALRTVSKCVFTTDVYVFGFIKTGGLSTGEWAFQSYLLNYSTCD